MKQGYKYYVYIMASASGTLYIGMTNNLIKRVREHKEGRHDGFTKKYFCDKLVYYEIFSSPGRAIFREKEIKKWRREKKENSIKTINPHWEDLYYKLY